VTPPPLGAAETEAADVVAVALLAEVALVVAWVGLAEATLLAAGAELAAAVGLAATAVVTAGLLVLAALGAVGATVGAAAVVADPVTEPPQATSKGEQRPAAIPARPRTTARRLNGWRVPGMVGSSLSHTCSHPIPAIAG
jgi:hypothetical protein